MRYNALSLDYEEVEVLDKPALFTSLRVDRSTVPDGLHLYEVRGDDYGGADPVQIAKSIIVNHYGSIILAEELNLQEDGCLDIDPEEDWNFSGQSDITIEEFQKAYQ